MSAIKMSKYARGELALQNRARALAGLPLLKVKVRNCLGCQLQFEGTGNRFCAKCAHEVAAVLSGHSCV